ncbi:hypothetical protein MARPO_0023s0074 [Marchantia polymorpha]|uniref:Uncharacterized protein n=1 Tax=Marchantia polymorpha TaxID=3197 RepID=A0A2R6XCD1_MARPO|nr:hypothetical protein MARPO_0023s0074 [Marchantia polymorpha]|eukprot:PTQ43752.1 hypothetical protein MARPO_0023s0074 [Marchantia polymorpha]
MAQGSHLSDADSDKSRESENCRHSWLSSAQLSCISLQFTSHESGPKMRLSNQCPPAATGGGVGGGVGAKVGKGGGGRGAGAGLDYPPPGEIPSRLDGFPPIANPVGGPVIRLSRPPVQDPLRLLNIGRRPVCPVTNGSDGMQSVVYALVREKQRLGLPACPSPLPPAGRPAGRVYVWAKKAREVTRGLSESGEAPEEESQGRHVNERTGLAAVPGRRRPISPLSVRRMFPGLHASLSHGPFARQPSIRPSIYPSIRGWIDKERSAIFHEPRRAPPLHPSSAAANGAARTGLGKRYAGLVARLAPRAARVGAAGPGAVASRRANVANWSGAGQSTLAPRGCGRQTVYPPPPPCPSPIPTPSPALLLLLGHCRTTACLPHLLTLRDRELPAPASFGPLFPLTCAQALCPR